ncbi:MAG: 5-formyltetrahydrofolate cyclo-ligase [Syntrophobacteraceae bacterium]
MEEPTPKGALRDRLTGHLETGKRRSTLPGVGQIAERLRKLPFYKEARHILCSPVSELFQIRLNGLMDGKILTVPTPGLAKGFLMLDPGAIESAQRFQAARLLGNVQKERRIPYDRPLPLPIDLAVADVLAADADGHVLGDGSGHLDLQIAILNHLGWLSPDVVLVTVVAAEGFVPAVPADETDVRTHWVLTPDRAVRTSASGFPRAEIHWEMLAPRSIRRNAALFHLHHSLRKGIA